MNQQTVPAPSATNNPHLYHHIGMATCLVGAAFFYAMLMMNAPQVRADIVFGSNLVSLFGIFSLGACLFLLETSRPFDLLMAIINKVTWLAFGASVIGFVVSAVWWIAAHMVW